MDMIVFFFLQPEPRVIPWRDYIIKRRGGSNPKNTNSARLLLPGNKTTSCTHLGRQIVQGGDVTLLRCKSGLNLKDTWMYYCFTFCAKIGWCLTVEMQPFLWFARFVIAKTKLQYQSDMHQEEGRFGLSSLKKKWDLKWAQFKNLLQRWFYICLLERRLSFLLVKYLNERKVTKKFHLFYV